MDDKNIELLVNLIILAISIIISFLIFFCYTSEQSLYFNILKLISLLEIAFLYSKYLSIKETKNFIEENIISLDTYKSLTLLIKFNFDFISSNKYLYQATKGVYIILNIILTIETIILIKRPFNHSTNRINLYKLLSVILLILSMIIQKFIDEDKYRLINDILYFIFVISGIISIVFTIIRFCLNKPLIQSAKNLFVVRHIIYIIILSLIFINELSFFESENFTKRTIVFCLGIIMSLVKISEKFFCCEKNTPKKFKKKGASSMISSNLNAEFMCCILYGMTHIFKKNKDKAILDQNEKTHLIKYLNTIDSKKNDIKSIRLDFASEIEDELIDDNYDEKKERLSLNSGGVNNGEDASITVYFPKKFDDLRKKDGITDDIMIKCFTPSKNKMAIDKMGEGKGKSGSFFFYSYDRKFIIKTITNEEKETMRKILLDYYLYIKERNENNNTLITKIYGIFTVVIKNASSVNVILMQNLFGCSPIHIQRMFDLKGSSVQRKTKNVQKWKKDQVLKDMDYQWITKVESKLINFNKDNIKKKKKNLENDIIFFKRLNLMDYSLLFIIVDYPEKLDPDYNQIIELLFDPKYKGHVYQSEDKKFIYIIGIIDYLQIYNFRKRIETFWKGVLYGKEKNMISAVEPNYYGERFQNFMTKNVFVSEPIS